MDICEQLELAAKAAGMFVLPEPWPEKSGWFFCPSHGRPAMHFRDHTDSHSSRAPWMPLDDDGDSRRLQAALNIALSITAMDSVAFSGRENINYIEVGHSSCSDDAAASARLAVLRMAAEIGRTM